MVIPNSVTCSTCGGSGYIDGTICHTCLGGGSDPPHGLQAMFKYVTEQNDDIKDKVKNVKDKVKDVKEKVDEIKTVVDEIKVIVES